MQQRLKTHSHIMYSCTGRLHTTQHLFVLHAPLSANLDRGQPGYLVC
jgi:hypothetical protein